MKFQVESVWDFGQKVLKEYPQLKEYNSYVENNVCYIEIESLEKLLELQNNLASPLIINQNTLEIYDDYRE
ncbi:MAG: hypothetical protein K0Q49_2479 [Haloplasmataceae bacterium]|jgi:hypothetical protein|nr:hypothetical protein [Haloplasmataceae bacterium]